MTSPPPKTVADARAVCLGELADFCLRVLNSEGPKSDAELRRLCPCRAGAYPGTIDMKAAMRLLFDLGEVTYAFGRWTVVSGKAHTDVQNAFHGLPGVYAHPRLDSH